MERRTLLANIPLFESIDEADLEALTKRLEPRSFKQGANVFREGESGATMFIIEEGAIDVHVGEGKANVVLRSLFAGQYFGELSLFDGAPRSATATVMKDCVLLALDRDDFVEFVNKHPHAAVRIMAEMAERMRATNTLMSRQVSRNISVEADDSLTFGQRVADRVASFGGSWTFIGTFALIMAVWMCFNSIRGDKAFDAYPFILLNLVLSSLAALQAPVIMMSQNRQASKDKLLAQNDYEVNLKSEMGIEVLIKGQAELLAKVALLERRLEAPQRAANQPFVTG